MIKINCYKCIHRPDCKIVELEDWSLEHNYCNKHEVISSYGYRSLDELMKEKEDLAKQVDNLEEELQYANGEIELLKERLEE